MWITLRQKFVRGHKEDQWKSRIWNDHSNFPNCWLHINTEDEENDLSAESEDVSNEKSKRFNQYMKNFLLN